MVTVQWCKTIAFSETGNGNQNCDPEKTKKRKKDVEKIKKCHLLLLLLLQQNAVFTKFCGGGRIYFLATPAAQMPKLSQPNARQGH